MRQVHLIISLLTITILLLPFDYANAQFGTGNFTSGYATPLYIGREWGSWTQSQKPNGMNRNFIKSLDPKKRNLSAAPSILLTFKVSSTVRRRNLARFVATTRKVDPEGATKMEQLFASTDVIGQISKAIAPYGLRTNNVADAYAVYWTSAWLGSQERSDDLSTRQMIAVRNQAAEALLATLPFKSATDVQKQELAEAMLIQAALIDSFLNSAKSDPALMAKVKVAITQGAKGMGLDLDRMTLTSQGFEFTK
ncbi:DUF6683 family protein [Chamaesiphon sp. VAR_48_metabat_135_sub]|uniref:DUF6683 family protein n=1 Tax=Chamaesiphon sp. VAR_48_metabat_135_sub TaxID=2964699 RepID=UPI00286B292A|nr:DUF6683 family protein [Chamaesiphon sp. VAR_48_metabat_135_sub]